MRTDRVTFRNAAADDAERIMEVLQAFGRRERGTDAWAARRESIARDPAQWRVGECDRQVVSAIHLATGAVWFGRSRFAWADVGEVSVLPTMQGRGIGTAAMSDAVSWQVERGVAVSRLGGLVRFYRRAGYEPFPRQYVEFPIPKTIAAGASRLSFSDLLTPKADDTGRVRPADESRDGDAVLAVMTAHNRHRTGCRVLDRSPHDLMRTRKCIVYEQAGKVLGFTSFAVYDHDGGAFESRLTADVMVYVPDCVPALEAMVKHLLRLALEAGAHRMTVLLPPDTATLRDLMMLGVSHNMCQEFGLIAGNMIRIVSLRHLLSGIADELGRRVGRVGWRGQVLLDLGDQRATLQIGDDGVQVRVDDGADGVDVTVKLTHAEMLRTVLGVMPPAWPELIRADHPAYRALAAMFPSTAGGFNT